MSVPKHIAIIMDGNGRWAARRGKTRAAGHRAGVDALRDTVEAAGKLGVSYLTVYAFSSENWSRPQSEITDLLGLFRLFFRSDLERIDRNGVHLRFLGDRDSIDADLLKLIAEAEETTKNNNALHLQVAFNYGSRDEITRAVRVLAQRAANGLIDPTQIDQAMIESALDTRDIPDPDLIIRTSGEERMSNFLLWQAAYAELLFMPCLWPDFGEAQLIEAIDCYNRRERRFGNVLPIQTATG